MLATTRSSAHAQVSTLMNSMQNHSRFEESVLIGVLCGECADLSMRYAPCAHVGMHCTESASFSPVSLLLSMLPCECAQPTLELT